MGELAQELIKTRAQNRSWTLQSYPGRVKLPSDIFRSLPNPEAAAKVCVPHFIISFFKLSTHILGGQILKTVYLPQETVEWLTETAKPQKPAATAASKVCYMLIPH